MSSFTRLQPELGDLEENDAAIAVDTGRAGGSPSLPAFQYTRILRRQLLRRWPQVI